MASLKDSGSPIGTKDSNTATTIIRPQLTVNAGANGTITAPATSPSTYNYGESVAIAASPNVGYRFVNWTGDVGTVVDVNAASTTITMNGNYAITANFAESITYILTTAVGGGGGGTIDPPTGDHTYNKDDVVTVTATADTGYLFDYWVGCTSSTNSCQVTMDGNKTVTAYFVVSHNLTVAVATDRGGPGGNTSPAAGIHAYAENSTVPVTASANPGYTFSQWTGDCMGTDPDVCSVTMDADKAVTANFAINQYALTVTRAGTGSGSVTSDPSGIDCGGSCSHDFDYNTLVTLTANAAVYSFFDGWSGGCSGIGPCSVTMNAIQDVIATFTLGTPSMTVSKTALIFTSSAGVPSAEQSYTVSGSYLHNDVTITAPADFQISKTSGSGWGDSLTLSPVEGTVPETTIYVRFLRSTVGTSSGNITHISGAIEKDVAVNGTAIGSTIIKSVDKATAGPGDTLNYTIDGISYTGSDLLTDVSIVDSIPAGASYVADSDTPEATVTPADDATATLLTWNIGSNTAGTPGTAGNTETVTLDGTPDSNTFTSSASVSLSHTTGSGSNRLMMVGISFNCSTTSPLPTINTVTFTPSGGSTLPLTLVGSKDAGSSRVAAIYYLPPADNPTSGTAGTVAVTFTGSTACTTGIVVGAANFQGVDQTTPLGAVASNSSTSTQSISVDVTTTGSELVFDTVEIGYSSDPGLTMDPSQTSLWNLFVTGKNTSGGASTKAAASGTTAMNWTRTAAAGYMSLVAVPIKPASVVARTTTLSTYGTLTSTGVPFILKATLTNTAADTNVTPGTLTPSYSGDATGVTCGSPTPASGSIAAGGSLDFWWTCIPTTTNVGTVALTLSGVTGASYSYPSGLSNTVLVIPALTFQATIMNPPGIGQIDNTASLKDNGTTIGIKDSNTATTIIRPLLTVNAGTGGTITAPATSPSTYDYGEVVAITASPNVGYHFVNWTGDVSTVADVNAASTTIAMNGNYVIAANFAINSYTLTYNAGPGGSITGTTPQTVNYDADGSEVTAEPNTGYHFTSWSDGVLTASRTDTHVKADKTVTANFADTTAPVLSLVHIQSNNADTARATAGDTVTLSFTASESIQTLPVSIAGHAATVSGGPMNWSATYVMANGDPEGVVAFSIAFSDLAGNAGADVIATTDASSVTFEWTLAYALAYVQNNTTLSGTLDDLTATFPMVIPPVVVAEPYLINSRMTLGSALPAGSKITIVRDGVTEVSNLALSGAGPFWYTGLLGYPLSASAPFDAGYGGASEHYVITVTGNPYAINTTLTIESIISRDLFSGELVVLASHEVPVVVAADLNAALALVQDETTLSGTLDDLTATFPDEIPAVLDAEPYKINSRLTLGAVLPAGTTMTIVKDGVTQYSGPAPAGVGPYWYTELLGIDLSNAADFDDGTYGGLTEHYVITLSGNPTAIDTTLKVESIISKDGFTNNVVLAEITLPVVVILPPVVTIGPSGLSWEGVPGATEYQVWYSSTEPYFTPPAGASAPPTTTDPYGYTFPDDTTDYYYIVRAINGPVQSDNSNRVGRFCFQLVPGSEP